MKIKLLIAVLSLATAVDFAALVPAALAQPTTSAASKKPSATPAEEVASKTVSIAEKAQKCLKIEDKPDDRLHCYDDAVKPQPTPNPPTAKGIRDCRRIADVDQRLSCFDGFAVQIPKFTH